MKNPFASLAVASLIIITSTRVAAQTLADTPENRKQQAARYLQATSAKSLFADMAQKMAANMPPAQRQQFVELFTSQLDFDALTKVMSDAIIKHFTAEEIKALADFYGSSVGKSAMSKMGSYMADLMPAIQAEIMKAQEKITKKPSE